MHVYRKPIYRPEVAFCFLPERSLKYVLVRLREVFRASTRICVDEALENASQNVCFRPI